MNAGLQKLGAQLSTYLSETWKCSVTIESVEQISGGASRQTYRIKLKKADKEENLILRRDPATSLIDTERQWEYRTYEAVYGTCLPVPEPILLEEDSAVLNQPFSLMREIGDCESALAALLTSPFVEHQDSIGHQFWTYAGKLSALSIDELGVNSFMPVHDHPAQHELNYWTQVIRNDQLHPQPVAEACIRWLNKHLPDASGEQCLVHGDYRSGNFLYNKNGEIKGILDWEMAHIGDPLEDLAWSLEPLWGQDKFLAGNLLPRERAIEIWESASGIKVNREAFQWWQMFASLKGLAIWISSAEDFANGQSKEPILALAGWLLGEQQNRIIVDRLSPSSAHQLVEALV